MFGIDPVATLSHILAQIQATIMPVFTPPPPQLREVGVASFSSGIGAMKAFIASMRPSGLLREIIDFDSPHIVGMPAELTVTPGAVSSCYTQRSRPNPPPGYRYMAPGSFARLTSFTDPHACIGWMMYYTAMLTSSIG
ncbi:MAG: hypothetical protein NW204_09470 [Xanthomonadaceae bacterium]|nr:hypothetical protein [Xanthomonadaceae bacterium]